MSDLIKEISRRRTFAIISHPDAGKTTLTEKFLLYGGAIAQAGVVKGKKNSRAAARSHRCQGTTEQTCGTGNPSPTFFYAPLDTKPYYLYNTVRNRTT